MNNNNEEFKTNKFANYGLFGGGALFLVGLLYIIKYQSNKGLRPGEMLDFDKLEPQTKKMFEKWKCKDNQHVECPEWKKYCESRNFDICKIGYNADLDSSICMYRDSKCIPRKFENISEKGFTPLKTPDANNIVIQREHHMEALKNSKKNTKIGGNKKNNTKKNQKKQKSKKKAKKSKKK